MAYWWSNFLAGFSLNSVASLIGSVAGLIVAIAAWRGVGTWRHELVGRRRADAARAALAMFYEAREAIRRIRFAGTYAGEMRLTPGDDPDWRRSAWTVIYRIRLDRIANYDHLWSRMEAARFEFGEEMAAHFMTILGIRTGISNAANFLIRMPATEGEPGVAPLAVVQEPTDQQRWEQLVGLRLQEPDPSGHRVEVAIQGMEAVCRPAIEGYFHGRR